MSMFMFCAAPAIALPTVKNRMAPSITGLRPNISARAPVSGRMAVLEREYAEPTHVNSSPPLRSLVMVGSAVLTAVRSRALSRMDTMRAMKVSQKAEPFPGLLFGAGSGECPSESAGVEDLVDIEDRGNCEEDDEVRPFGAAHYMCRVPLGRY